LAGGYSRGGLSTCYPGPDNQTIRWWVLEAVDNYSGDVEELVKEAEGRYWRM